MVSVISNVHLTISLIWVLGSVKKNSSVPRNPLYSHNISAWNRHRSSRSYQTHEFRLPAVNQQFFSFQWRLRSWICFAGEHMPRHGHGLNSPHCAPLSSAGYSFHFVKLHFRQCSIYQIRQKREFTDLFLFIIAHPPTKWAYRMVCFSSSPRFSSSWFSIVRTISSSLVTNSIPAGTTINFPHKRMLWPFSLCGMTGGF